MDNKLLESGDYTQFLPNINIWNIIKSMKISTFNNNNIDGVKLETSLYLQHHYHSGINAKDPDYHEIYYNKEWKIIFLVFWFYKRIFIIKIF